MCRDSFFEQVASFVNTLFCRTFDVKALYTYSENGSVQWKAQLTGGTRPNCHRKCNYSIWHMSTRWGEWSGLSMNTILLAITGNSSSKSKIVWRGCIHRDSIRGPSFNWCGVRKGVLPSMRHIFTTGDAAIPTRESSSIDVHNIGGTKKPRNCGCRREKTIW